MRNYDYKSELDRLSKPLRKNASVKELVLLWYDNTDRSTSLRQMDLDLLIAMIRKWAGK